MMPALNIAMTNIPTVFKTVWDAPLLLVDVPVGVPVLLPFAEVPFEVVLVSTMGWDKSLYAQADELHKQVLPMGSHQGVSHVSGIRERRAV